MVSAPERLTLDPAAILPRVIGRYTPVTVDHGKGLYVWDVNGERYADYTSGIGVVNTGHCHPRVVEAIQEQAAKIIHAQANIFVHEPVLKASAALVATLPDNLNQVFWTNSGAEATEGTTNRCCRASTSRPTRTCSAARTAGRRRSRTSSTSPSWKRCSTSS